MSTLTNDTLKAYFLKEMAHLRQASVRFGKEYPHIAQELALNQERSDDPQVELLLQSFAFLSGQLRYQMAVDDAELPNQLLSALNPHLEMPWPSRSVMQLDVLPDGASFDKTNSLPAHSMFSANLPWNDELVPCRFRTMKAVEVWPLQVAGSSVQSHTDFDEPGAVSGVKVRVRVAGHYSLQSMPVTRLQFFIDGPDRFLLHDLLFSQLAGVTIRDPHNSKRRVSLKAKQCRFVNDIQLDSILPGQATVHPGLANLREYFSFPDHLLFFELGSLDLSQFGQEIDVVFLLKKSISQIDPNSFKLNCVPVINLFKQVLEPFSVVAGKQEYLLSADQFRHPVTEVVAVDQIRLQGVDGRTRDLPPLYGSTADISDGYWLARRELSQVASVPGTEFYLCFVEGRLQAVGLQTAKAAGKAWCCNRRLPERLGMHSKLNMEGAGPVQSGRLLRKPSRHYTPALSGDRSRQLVMQLTTHFQPFENSEMGVRRLRDMLRQQTDPGDPDAQAQIDAIVGLNTRRVTRRLGDDQWRGFCHGVHWQVKVDTDRFGRGSPLLFARALNESIQHRVPINSFIELELLEERTGESLYRWLPTPGALWQI